MIISVRPTQRNIMHTPTTQNSSAESLEDYIVEHLEMNGHKVEIMQNGNGLTILNTSPSVTKLQKHFWKQILFLQVSLFREEIYFLISETADQHTVHSWNTERPHETIMYTWKSPSKLAQTAVLQTL